MTNPTPASKRTPKVLIADDDPGILRFLANQCAKMGFEVQTAVNGMQALLIAGRNHPDVLIIDINMPGIDGLSVSERLLDKADANLDVIVITASSYPETGGRCGSFGAFHVRKGPDLWEGVRSALYGLFPEMLEESVEDKKASGVTWERPRVLIVDSDPNVGTFLSSRFRKAGVDVLLAHNSLKGFQIACKEEPTVIITDHLLPDVDAQYLLQKLRSTPITGNIPVFVMTARRLDHGTETMLRRDLGGRGGVAAFLIKSTDTEELFGELQKYCGFTNNPNPPERFVTFKA